MLSFWGGGPSNDYAGYVIQKGLGGPRKCRIIICFLFFVQTMLGPIIFWDIAKT